MIELGKRLQKSSIIEGQRVTGAQALMQALVDNDVEVIFGYPGGAIMPAYDALYTHGQKLRHILVRHEQGAGHMAEGYARVTKKPGVILVTSGPGALNTFTALRDAFMDSTPMVVISGQVPSPFIGTEAFQEAPVTDSAAPLTKASFLVKSPEEIAPTIFKAFAIAQSGRPGPVLVDIPKDFQLAETFYYYDSPNGEYANPPLNEDKRQLLVNAARLLDNAQKPLIIAGNGIHASSAYEELLRVVGRSGTPIATTLQGLSSISSEHPLSVGMVGMHGRLGANVLTNQADVILAVGMRFDDRVTGSKIHTYAPQARIIHVDIDPKQLGKVLKREDRPDQTLINLDANLALKVLGMFINNNAHPDWLNQFRQMDAEEDSKITSDVLSPNAPDYKMAEVIHELSRLTSGEALVVADVGQHQMVTAQRYGFRNPNSFITSGGMGTMGFALPAAIGAKIGAPDREVVAISGDGSFQMTPQELGVMMQEGIPVKVIVLNNSYLGMVRFWQDRFHGGRHSQVDIESPDFAKLASAYGISGERARRPQGLRGRMIEGLSSRGIPVDRLSHQKDIGRALDRMLSSKGPYVLEVQVEKSENVFPMMQPGSAVDEMVME